jgi:hypothetical protein
MIKYYIKDDGVAKLGQLHFYCLQISFCIQTFWSHDTVCHSFERTVL